MSESTTVLQTALRALHPHVIVSVDEEVIEGVNHLTVIGVDYDRGGSQLTTLCVDLFARARAESDLPLSVSVQGMGDAGRRLDTELDNLAAYIRNEYGVNAIVVFAWDHGGPEFGELEVVADDPIQVTILSEMLNRKPS